MFQVRKQQLEAITRAQRHRFENSMVAHVKEFFPNHFNMFKETKVREVIGYGIERARFYGFTTERSLSLYITQMFMMGSNFDEDILLPWAKAILSDKNIPNQTLRINELMAKTSDYFGKISGDDNKWLFRALLRLRDGLAPFLIQKPAGNIEDHIAIFLHGTYPEKYAYVVESGLLSLIRKGVNEAGTYQITSDRGVSLWVVFMFMLGTAFVSDPQFSWAREILKNDSILDPEKKVDMLYAEGMTILEGFLA